MTSNPRSTLAPASGVAITFNVSEKNMPIPLSSRVSQLVSALFPEAESRRISERLLIEASENIPFHEDATPEGMDRVRFAILKRIKQSRKNEDPAFEDAKCDWRDLYVSAGFSNSATAHDAWFEKIINSKV